jgi:NAD+ synthase (glutamine-hydrolysing)
MRELTIGGAALNQTPMDWAGNARNIRRALQIARDQGIEVLCLPELCITGYGCEDLFLSPWLSEKAVDVLAELLPHCHGIVVSIGLPVRIDHAVYNCAALVDDGKLLGIAAKQFLANEGVHYEPRWFTPWKAGDETQVDIGAHRVPFGDIVFPVLDTTIGFEICEDAWRTDRPGCRFPQRGVEIILNPSASHFGFGKTRRREKLIREGSEKFNCYYVYANLLGNEAGRMIYDGEILLAGYGHFLGLNEKLSFQDVNVFARRIDLDNRNPFDQRIEIPDEDKNDIFVRAEALALFDYMRKSRSRGFVLSLSGGADSSTCAVLIAEMVRRSVRELGWREVIRKLDLKDLEAVLQDEMPESRLMRTITGNILTCAYQATVNSSQETLRSARDLAAELGATFHHWEIDDVVGKYVDKV